MTGRWQITTSPVSGGSRLFVTITGTITDFKVDVTRDSVTDVTAPAVRYCAAAAASSAAKFFSRRHIHAPHKYREERF